MLKQGRRRASLLLLASLLLAGCSALPQRGFATRFFQSDIEPELNPKGAFEGSPTIAPDGSVVPPGSCEAIARERAQDVAVQDFSLEVQQTVFDHTLRDCKAWRGRTGVLERRP
jgi:hypothetical protein